MKNKKLLAMTAMVITASVLMTACSFSGKDKSEETPAAEVTPTAEAAEPTATPAPTAEPTIAPNVQSTTYTSTERLSLLLFRLSPSTKYSSTPSVTGSAAIPASSITSFP